MKMQLLLTYQTNPDVVPFVSWYVSLQIVHFADQVFSSKLISKSEKANRTTLGILLLFGLFEAIIAHS